MGPFASYPSRLTRANEVPLEFTTAAFRFGHSMVSAAYDFNANFGVKGPRFQRRRTAGGAVRLHLAPEHGAGRAGAAGAAGPLGDRLGPDDAATAGPTGHPAARFRQCGTHRPELRARHAEPGGRQQGGGAWLDPVPQPDARVPPPHSLWPGSGRALWRCPPDRGRGPRRPCRRKPCCRRGRRACVRWRASWVFWPKPRPGSTFLCESRIRENGDRVGATASHIIADTIVGLMRLNPGSLLNPGRPWHPRQSRADRAGGRGADLDPQAPALCGEGYRPG
jgi:hypothetical protein